MSAYMSVDKLAELLKSLGVENLDVTIEYIRPGKSSKFDMADARTGCNYPPYGHKIVRIEEPPEVRIMAEGKCYKPTHVELQARDVLAQAGGS